MLLTIMQVHRKRAALFLVLVVVLFGLAIHQARKARATPTFLPMILGIVVSGHMGVIAAIEMYDGAPKAESAVGAKALSVTIGDNSGGEPSAAVRIPTTVGAASAASIPAPSAPATVTAVPHWALAASSPGCPNYAAGGTGYCTGTGDCNQTTGKCTQSFQNWCPIGSTCLQGGLSTSGPFLISSGTNTNVQGYYGAWCGDGYTGSGTCTLVNARAAVPDQKQDLQRVGTTLSKIAGDNDAAVNAVLSTKYVSNDSADVSGMSVSGQPRLVRTTALASGGSEVTQVTQKTDGSGATYLENRAYQIDASGTITAATSSNTVGALAATGASEGSGAVAKYVQTGSGAAYTPAAPGSGAGTGTGQTGQGSGSCGGAGQPACSVVVNDSGFAGQYSGPAAGTHDTALGSQKAQMEALDAPGITWADWMPTLKPGTATSCHAVDFTGSITAGPAAGLSSTYGLDLCPVLEVIRQILGWLFGIGTTIYIWRRFVGARGGEGV